MLQNKTHILFDLDGTLTDSKPGITRTIQHALKQFNIHVQDLNELTRFIGPPLSESFQKFYNFSHEDAELAIKHYRDYYKAKEMHYESVLYPNIINTLKMLKEGGYTLAVATAKPTVFANLVVKKFGLDPYFDFVAGASLDKSRVTKDKVIQHALDQLKGVPSKQFIMIGDREHDMMGAKAHGLKAIGVLYGYGSEKELQEGGADHVIGDHGELLEYL